MAKPKSCAVYGCTEDAEITVTYVPGPFPIKERVCRRCYVDITQPPFPQRVNHAVPGGRPARSRVEEEDDG